MRDYHTRMDKRMFDFADFYSSVARRMPDTGAVLAEVGVATGSSAVFLAEELLNLGKEFKLLMIDNLAYGGPDQLRELIQHITAANLTHCVEIVPVDSLNAAARYPDVHFDFVFLDSSHLYDATKAEIRCWYPKIKEGGVLAGHDYIGHLQVQEAVDFCIPREYTRAPIPTQTFEPETLLRTSDKGFGVWWVEKKFYVRLN